MAVLLGGKKIGAHPRQHGQDEQPDGADKETKPPPLEQVRMSAVAEDHAGADGEEDDAEAADQDHVQIGDPIIREKSGKEESEDEQNAPNSRTRARKVRPIRR